MSSVMIQCLFCSSWNHIPISTQKSGLALWIESLDILKWMANISSSLFHIYKNLSEFHGKINFYFQKRTLKFYKDKRKAPMGELE